MGVRIKKRTRRPSQARRRRRPSFAGRLTLTILIVVVVAVLLRQMVMRSRSFRSPRRQSGREFAPPANPSGSSLSQSGSSSTPVPALPKQRAQSNLPKAEARALLRREADAIVQAIESGRAFGKRTNTIVEAHFDLGTSTWNVREAVAPGVAPQFVAASANATAGERWRFIAFRSPEGQRLEPMFVFFPDGTVQGGMVELGWDDLHAVLGLDASGRVTVECPGAFPVAAPTLPPPGAGVDKDSKGNKDDKNTKDSKDLNDNKDPKDQRDSKDN